MSWLRDTLALYRDVFAKGFRLFARNPVLVVPVFATLGVPMFIPVLAPLGFAGGIIMVVLQTMCWSALLAATGDAIRTGRVDLDDVRAGFIEHFRDVLNVRFVLWIASFVLSMLPGSPLHVLALVGAFVFFNAVPELIYLGRYGTTDLLRESYRFMSENWIEWAPPNVLMVLVIGAVPVVMSPVLEPLGSGLSDVIVLGVMTSLVAVTMVVRGLLFEALTQSSRRARAFRGRVG